MCHCFWRETCFIACPATACSSKGQLEVPSPVPLCPIKGSGERLSHLNLSAQWTEPVEDCRICRLLGLSELGQLTSWKVKSQGLCWSRKGVLHRGWVNWCLEGWKERAADPLNSAALAKHGPIRVLCLSRRTLDFQRTWCLFLTLW